MASFFESTLGFRRQTAALFDFVTPTAVAMWNLRWQIQGYVGAVPSATKEDLQGRFIAGADFSRFDMRRANLRRAALEWTWDEQLEEFARVLLFASIGLYEGWLAETMALFPSGESRIKNLQFPSRGVAGNTKDGVTEALRVLTTQPSRSMQRTFVPPLEASPKFSVSTLDALLTCYRYFKECRNSLLHAGGTARQELEDLSALMTTLTPAALGTSFVPEHMVVMRGAPVRLSLRGVIGFCDVLFRIVSTIDARLAGTLQGEAHYVSRWKQTYGSKKLRPELARRERQIAHMSGLLGFPRPVRPRELDRLLRGEGLVVT